MQEKGRSRPPWNLSGDLVEGPKGREHAETVKAFLAISAGTVSVCNRYDNVVLVPPQNTPKERV